MKDEREPISTPYTAGSMHSGAEKRVHVLRADPAVIADLTSSRVSAIYRYSIMVDYNVPLSRSNNKLTKPTNYRKE